MRCCAVVFSGDERVRLWTQQLDKQSKQRREVQAAEERFPRLTENAQCVKVVSNCNESPRSWTEYLKL
jgi:hypothetical protein